MSSVFEMRPDFYDGQYIGAKDLDAIVSYARNHLARHALGPHTWGIVTGLDLVEMTGPSGELDVFLMPGYAVDGYGRGVVVMEPCRLTFDLFAGLPSQAAPLWIRYDEGQMQGVRKGFGACATADGFSRVGEGYRLETGNRFAVIDRQAGVSIAGEAVADARMALRAFDDQAPFICDGSVPFQELPRSPDADRWLIPLGLVGWQTGAIGKFVALTDAQRLLSRRLRRNLGIVTESILATEGVIRLRDRFTWPKTGKDIDELCAADELAELDHRICKERPEFNELIWLEGRVRVTNDVRLFGARLEFRDSKGSGYSEESGGPSTPLLIQRDNNNEREGQDLELLVGKSEDGRNRLVVGRITATEDPAQCTTTFSDKARLVVVQDDGNVGVGTTLPDHLVTLERGGAAHLNIRTAAAPGGTELMIGVSNAGATVSAMSNHDLRLRAGGNLDRMIVKATGEVGIGTTAPGAKLDIRSVPATPGGGALGADKWIRAGDGGDSGRFWVEYGAESAPLMVLSDLDGPPRLQFQQLGENGSEEAPEIKSWIGHAGANSGDLALIGGNVGIGTSGPLSKLHVMGNVRIDGNHGDHFAAVAKQAVRLIAGEVDDDGDIVAGTGFSVSHVSTGFYDVTFTNDYPSPPIVVASVVSASSTFRTLRVHSVSESGFHIHISELGDLFGTSEDSDSGFSFMVQGTRG